MPIRTIDRTGMHSQTLRKYERAGLLTPLRPQGNQRLYSVADLRRLKRIRYLVEVRGINIAGLELALAMSDRLDALGSDPTHADLQSAVEEASEMARDPSRQRAAADTLERDRNGRGGRIEPTTTSPPDSAIESADVRPGLNYERTGHLFDGSDRGRATTRVSRKSDGVPSSAVSAVGQLPADDCEDSRHVVVLRRVDVTPTVAELHQLNVRIRRSVPVGRA